MAQEVRREKEVKRLEVIRHVLYRYMKMFFRRNVCGVR